MLQSRIDRADREQQRREESTMSEPKKPSTPPKKPGDITPEQAKKLIEGAKRKGPAEKDQTNPPKK